MNDTVTFSNPLQAYCRKVEFERDQLRIEYQRAMSANEKLLALKTTCVNTIHTLQGERVRLRADLSRMRRVLLQVSRDAEAQDVLAEWWPMMRDAIGE